MFISKLGFYNVILGYRIEQLCFTHFWFPLSPLQPFLLFLLSLFTFPPPLPQFSGENKSLWEAQRADRSRNVIEVGVQGPGTSDPAAMKPTRAAPCDPQGEPRCLLRGDGAAGGPRAVISRLLLKIGTELAQNAFTGKGSCAPRRKRPQKSLPFPREI